MFPLAFLFKSTPAELALAAFLLVGAALAIKNPSRLWAQLDSSMQCLLLAAIILGAALVTSNLNLGQRYMIPLYPILIIAACDRIALHLQHRPGWLAMSVAALLVLQCGSSMSVGPHYLAYLNRLSGGPENGWRLLADSNVDWGQDLPALRDYLDEHPHLRVAMKYFGTALPQAYGVNADDIDHLQAAPESYSTLALSVTYLNGLHMAGLDPFREFRRLEPDSQIGYSIMLYDLQRPEALVAFREALRIMGRSGPPHHPEINPARSITECEFHAGDQTSEQAHIQKGKRPQRGKSIADPGACGWRIFKDQRPSIDEGCILDKRVSNDTLDIFRVRVHQEVPDRPRLSGFEPDKGQVLFGLEPLLVVHT